MHTEDLPEIVDTFEFPAVTNEPKLLDTLEDSAREVLLPTDDIAFEAAEGIALEALDTFDDALDETAEDNALEGPAAEDAALL